MLFKNIFIKCCLVTLVSSLFSCKKFIEIKPPENQLEESVVFSTDASALSAAFGVYANMVQTNLYICNGGTSLYPALSADELVYNATNAELLTFYNNSIIADDGTGIFSRLWVPAYKNIYFANSVMEGLDNSSGVTSALKQQLKGEMLVVRSLNIFMLLNLFGDVPLITSTDYKTNGVMPKMPSNDLYTRLVADLREAKDLLDETYTNSLKTRPNRLTASALLSKVYLVQKDWKNAEIEASTIIRSKKHKIEPLLNNVFSQFSEETIWQLASDYRNTGEGATFIPSSATTRPTYSLTSFLLNAFENDDLRKSNWLKYNLVGGKSYYYPYKYKVRASTPISEFTVVFRLAEQYLIRAEARAQLNNTTEAISDLDVIRSRAGLGNTLATSQSEVLSAIYKERQIELFCEWGNRWFDLKRTGSANDILSIRKAPYWDATDILYPIPAGEILNNPFLVQNLGY